MSRPLKFRGRSIKTGEWLYGSLVMSDDRAFIVGADTYPETFPGTYAECVEIEEVVPESVGQFTGLHDKNGVEIYEGAVVVPDGTKWSLVVRWFGLLGFDGGGAAHPGFYVSGVPIDERYEPAVDVAELDWLLTLVDCEIIGNIHESEVKT